MAGLVTLGQIHEDHWRDRAVLITGHTGFKGSWLIHLLAHFGAKIHGIALAPPSQPSLFDTSRAQQLLSTDSRIDVRDYESVLEVVTTIRPQTVFHMAAQPLVLRSNEMSLETISTNVVGTASILEAFRNTDASCEIVIVTTDKVYTTNSDETPRIETHPFGGDDLYSASKACAELVTAAYRRSIFRSSQAWLATARAGNVIGGGDWSPDRLFPDLFRAVSRKEALVLRHPNATRPWQHVLDALRGYVLLAEAMTSSNGTLPNAFNFGPRPDQEATVAEVLSIVAECAPHMPPVVTADRTHIPETLRLSLDSSAAREWLGWEPWWRLRPAISATIAWDSAWREGEDMFDFTQHQVSQYLAAHSEHNTS